MNIVVTGGAGFIGSHLVEKLLDQGHRVTTVDDLSNGHARFLEDWMPHPNHTFIEGTVTDRALVRRCLHNADLVFHLAAVLGVKNCVEDPLKVIEGNLDSTRIILEEAYQKSVKVVFASTSEVYGKNAELPFRETSDRVLGPTDVNRWCYATVKALDEHLCFAYSQKGLPVTIIRYFNAYGPRAISTAYGGVIPRFITAALRNEPLYVYGTGGQRRCFTYIDDVIRGTIAAIRPRANGLAFNLGSLFETTIRGLAETIVHLTRSTSPIVDVPYEQAYGKGYEDMPRRLPDLSRSEQILGYQPTTDLQSGLIKTIAWHMIETVHEQ
ncbi:NAD-dependent epimerase/dehydratase family protein [Alicyclobacillus cycloheptanicus]|uniref:UDP-glucose 4-epimerase n=1 Tax=Alicyclobacillus cycloheptanicus TaxID=1457 RepID=A0ABT9XKI7_9BACL|nr:UDP-glucose 4-epimerase [Alicyclobacillus cycloheptanicus]WDM01474.1 NAD-dependent epimerase/dehydratase family protein [Alicyclobacillus cycloheptanicus]